jgi:hypothetical protein
MSDGLIESSPTRNASTSCAQIAVAVHVFPIVVPVNYLLVETPGPVWLAIRTRPRSVLARGSLPVGFEIVSHRPARTLLHRLAPTATCRP